MQQRTVGNKEKDNMYKTLSQATTELERRGYKDQFAMNEDRLECKRTGKLYSPEDITIDEYHRFEGKTNYDDMSILYAVTAKDGTQGTLIDAYGTYSSPELDEFLNQLELTTE